MIAGVDTHSATHHAAVLDGLGRELGDQQFPATVAGYVALLGWVRDHGRVVTIGVEGTGSYGAGLTHHLQAAGVSVVEIDRPDRRGRRARGKSDPIDACAAARAALSGTHVVVPKARDGIVEAIRMLRITRRSAVKARTQTTTSSSLCWSPPHTGYGNGCALKTVALMKTCARLHYPPPDRWGTQRWPSSWCCVAWPGATSSDRGDPHRRRRTAPADHHRRPADAHPAGVVLEVTGQLLTTVGDNPERMCSEAAFAHLCGVAPIAASTGKTHRHRLNRAGDRAANNALYTVVLTRLRLDPRARAYFTRRRAEGLSRREITRCLQRYVARGLYHLLSDSPHPRRPGPPREWSGWVNPEIPQGPRSGGLTREAVFDPSATNP